MKFRFIGVLAIVTSKSVISSTIAGQLRSKKRTGSPRPDHAVQQWALECPDTQQPNIGIQLTIQARASTKLPFSACQMVPEISPLFIRLARLQP